MECTLVLFYFTHYCLNRPWLQVGNKLRELKLISSMKEITGKPLTLKRVWSEEEVAKLVTLYHEYKVTYRIFIEIAGHS